MRIRLFARAARTYLHTCMLRLPLPPPPPSTAGALLAATDRATPKDFHGLMSNRILKYSLGYLDFAS
jgi:hypothetical protein